MKFTWGHGITIAIIAFMSFIVYIVIQTFNLNADLVQDDFYEEEIRTNEKKTMTLNYNSLDKGIDVKKTENGVEIIFPDTLTNAVGEIQFYRRDDKRLDRLFEIALNSDNTQVFKYENFIVGQYDIKIECEKNLTKYLYQSSIIF